MQTGTQPTIQAVITHEKGSWKWQDRYELVEYAVHVTRDGRQVWRKSASINAKVTPRQMRSLVDSGIHYGGLHNKAVA